MTGDFAAYETSVHIIFLQLWIPFCSDLTTLRAVVYTVTWLMASSREHGSAAMLPEHMKIRLLKVFPISLTILKGIM